MSRYLTPAKIGLLALISIYIDSRVSTDSTIAVLSFVVGAIMRKFNSTWHETEEDSLVLSIEDFQQHLTEQTSSMPGRSLWDIFVQQLWSISSFDALHVFFDSTSALLERSRDELLSEAEDGSPEETPRIRLSRNSPLGTFVRRSYLEFSRLQIHDGIKLWKEFVAFREPTFSTWKKRHPVGLPAGNEEEQPLDLTLSFHLNELLYGDIPEDKPKLAQASTDDFERLLGAQIEQMQKTGQRVPKEIRERIHEMLTSAASASNLAHYGAFIDAWKAGDCSSAFDGLHRYFDYTMNVAGRSYYQYALLNMAFLHADFGCFPEAIAAVKESISMARENRDVACLNFSLSWLYNLGKKHPEELGEISKTGVLGADREALDIIKSKAKDTDAWSLLGSCLLAETELLLQNGESIAVAFENLAKVTHLNQTKHLNVPLGPQMRMESSLLARLGLAQLERSNSDLFREIYAEGCLSQDRIDVASQTAICLARGGRFDEALHLVQTVDPELLRVLKLRQPWALGLCYLHLRRALYKNDFHGVQHYLSRAKAIMPHKSEVAFEIRLCGIEYEMRRGEYSAALAALEALMASPTVIDGDVRNRLRLMVMKAKLFDKAGVPQKGFTIAIRAASVAYKSRNLLVLFHAVVALCRVLLSLGEYEATTELLIAVMPQVVECEDCELTGMAFLSLADAQMGSAGQAESGSPQRKEHMTKALEYLERAFGAFSTIHDVQGQCEAMAKRAMIMRVTGDGVLANDYAAKYLDIRRASRAVVEE